jgi:hypothetical protein
VSQLKPKTGRSLRRAFGPDAYLAAAEQYVDKMFSGGKAPLRPIYDELLRLGISIGSDVKACPCPTIVPLYRRHVFAQIKPAAQDRITHRIPISSATDIDDEVKRWLRLPYEEDV